MIGGSPLVSPTRENPAYLPFTAMATIAVCHKLRSRDPFYGGRNAPGLPHAGGYPLFMLSLPL